MAKNKPMIMKSILYALIMIIVVALVSAGTYFTVNYFFAPRQLNSPTNLLYQKNEITNNSLILWDDVKNADSYTLHILNRTTGDETTIFVYESLYVENSLNKIAYNITSEIEEIYNYSIMVKANPESNTRYLGSDYSIAYELRQVDSADDEVKEE